MNKIFIDHLKCAGCANGIKKNLESIQGVSSVEVNLEDEYVIFELAAELDISIIKQALHDMGYPEKGSSHGWDKWATNAKSYVSCAIGKFQP
jgi:copper chaperone